MATFTFVIYQNCDNRQTLLPKKSGSVSDENRNQVQDMRYLVSPQAKATGGFLSATPASGVCAIRPGDVSCSVSLQWRMPSQSEGCLFDRNSRKILRCANAGSAGTDILNGISSSGIVLDLRSSSNIDDPVIGSIELMGRPIKLGAIRFDAWSANSEVFDMNNLEQVGYKFYERLPFYAKIQKDGRWYLNSDTQAIADQEIDFATSRGISYFAFNYSRFTTRDLRTGRLPSKVENITNPYLRFNYKSSYALDLYLSSSKVSKPDFSLLIPLDIVNDFLNKWPPSGVSRKQAWDILLNDLRPYYARKELHKTPDRRPVLFLLGTEWLEIWDRDVALARQRLNELRHIVPNQSPPLFITMMSGYPTRLQEAVKILGVDSTTTYAHSAGTAENSTGHSLPFSEISVSSDWYLKTLSGDQALTPVDTIPNVTFGWDYRPLLGYSTYRSPSGNWFLPATATDLRSELDRAVNFALEYPDRNWSKSILLYAWNELAEGGFLVPTLENGSRILDAVASYQGIDISQSQISSLQPRTRPLVSRVGTGCSDGFGIWIHGSNFGEHPILELRQSGGRGPASDSILSLVIDPSRGQYGNEETLSFCLTGEKERNAFADAGLDISIVNPQATSGSIPFFLRHSSAGQSELAKPNIVRGGTGCEDGNGLWLMGNDFSTDSYVELRDTSQPSKIISTYSQLTRGTSGAFDTISFCLQTNAEKNAISGTGLDVSVTNPKGGGPSNMITIKK